MNYFSLSVVLRQPKGPDGTKGFTCWRASRSANLSPTVEKGNIGKDIDLKTNTTQ